MLTKTIFETQVTQFWTWPEENWPSSGIEGQQVSLCELMGTEASPHHADTWAPGAHQVATQD